MPWITTMIVLAGAVLLVLVTGQAEGKPTKIPSISKGTSRGYIVVLKDKPVLGYTGSIAGLKATKPRTGTRLDPSRSAVAKYKAYLDRRQTDVVKRAGLDNDTLSIRYRYRLAQNGFFAHLTPSQVEALAQSGDVAGVYPNRLRKILTDSTTLLGLATKGGLWDSVGGPSIAGERIVIGVIDTGIWPEAPSFSDQGSPAYSDLPTWRGECEAGDYFTPGLCNKKLVGARWFNDGWSLCETFGCYSGDQVIAEWFPADILSPRDTDGHGTHTASTAAGAANVTATVNGRVLGKTSGVAPRARIAAYKVFWGGSEDGAGGLDADIIAAIDAAVQDGVDVINYSAGGGGEFDPVQTAFLYAASNGIFVSAAAGNSGPGAATVENSSPWVTQVGAATSDATMGANVTLSNGRVYQGKSSGTKALPLTPIVLASKIGLRSATVTDARLCAKGALDPAKARGKIVFCDRGVNARVEKSANVLAAGGVGMVLANTQAEDTLMDVHSVPTVHVDVVSGNAIRTFVNRTSGARASISKSGFITIPAYEVAAFSSRGPSTSWDSDYLSPDLVAPGVDTLAAVSPLGNNDENFAFYSGTSMAAPHVAGVAALLRQLHPTWSPAAVKSALMTTATRNRSNGKAIPGDAWDYGAGAIRPKAAANPGLVFDAGLDDYLQFACNFPEKLSLPALGGPAVCAGGASPLYQFNSPAIVVGNLAGSVSVTRRVTNVETALQCMGRKAWPRCQATYTVSVRAPPNITVRVIPEKLMLWEAQSATFAVTMTIGRGVKYDEYLFGSLTWSDGAGGHVVRSPIVVRVTPLAVPKDVTGKASGVSIPVKFGYRGNFSLPLVAGLVPSTVRNGTIDNAYGSNFLAELPATLAGVKAFSFTIPPGTQVAAWQMFSSEAASPEDDFNLYLLNERVDEYIDLSAVIGSDESIVLVKPNAGKYNLFIHAFWLSKPTSTFKLHFWSIGNKNNGNVRVTAPSAVVAGQEGAVVLRFSNLTRGVRYRGQVMYGKVPFSNRTFYTNVLVAA